MRAEYATNIQTPILGSTKKWMDDFKKENKLDTYGDVIVEVIEVYKRTLMTPAQIDAASPSESPDAEWVIERALNVLHGIEMEADE
jgi:hypothetical protein